MTNFLKTANVSYEELVKQIYDRLAADPKFDNIRESAIFQMMNEIFCANANLLLHYIERRSEESFFTTAKIKGSVIELARGLGYSIQRAIPATCKIKIKIKGDISSNFSSGDVIQIPYHSQFSYNDTNYIIKSTLSYQVTQEMLDSMSLLGDDYEFTFDTDYKGDDIVLVEGEIREKVIEGSTNPLIGQKFQTYRIDDTTFSNMYSTDDFTPPTTRVFVGANKDVEYLIDKRSLINWESIANLSSSGSTNVCLIRSSIAEDCELIFGDDKFASIGAETTLDNIFIQYLSTKGSKGNTTGLIGEKIEYSGKVYAPNATDITDNIEFNFKSNPIGGADIEDIESIRMNAPEIYYSLDRLVSSRDYISYLKSLTSPFPIKNAIAWGEQEEIKLQGLSSDKKMFNIVLFCCLGNLYQTATSPYTVKEKGSGLDTAVLDADYNEDEIPIQSYLNLYVKEDQVTQLKSYSYSATYWDGKGDTNDYISTETVGQTYLQTTYGSTSILYVTIGSDIHETTITSAAPLTISMAGLTSITPISNAMIEVANRITTALGTVIDNRGLISTNPNKGQLAFPGAKCYTSLDISSKPIFGISGANSDLCYVIIVSGSMANDLGLSAYIPQKLVKGFSDPISENIVAVVDKLKDRSQITIQNIYTSPIIQTFGISGTVYVSPLYDIGTIQTEINDSIYGFLDLNADFNVPVYKSNIVELIEAVKGVKFVDCNFYPTYPSKSIGRYYDDLAAIYTPWITIYPATFFGYSIFEAFFLIVDGYLSYYSSLGATLTERKLYDTIKDNYSFIYNNAPLFTYSQDFNKCISLLRKDYLRYIRSNLINTYGDIGESITQSDGSIAYNYSLGSEIPKIKSNLTFTYRN